MNNPDNPIKFDKTTIITVLTSIEAWYILILIFIEILQIILVFNQTSKIKKGLPGYIGKRPKPSKISYIYIISTIIFCTIISSIYLGLAIKTYIWNDWLWLTVFIEILFMLLQIVFLVLFFRLYNPKYWTNTNYTLIILNMIFNIFIEMKILFRLTREYF